MAVRRRRRLLAALLGALATVSGLLVVGSATPASAVPVDKNWSTTSAPPSPATFTDVANGSSAPAKMTYSMNPAGIGTTRSWEFTTPATTTGQVKVPYTWQGLHAWFRVTTRLDAVVIPVSGPPIVTNLVAQGETSCCNAPSNGFVYGGVATFDVQAGQRYGFRISGSNRDFNNFLSGSLTLDIQPFFDATVVDGNRDWPGATDITEGDAPEADRLIARPGEARWFKFEVDPDQDVKATLTAVSGAVDSLPADYDVALYGDIAEAFRQYVRGDDLAQLAASSASTGVAGTQVPDYPIETSRIPTETNPPSGQQFAPRVYAPRVYAPRVYAPRVYAPRVYAPRVYAPRVYAPGSYVPQNFDSSLSDAFSAAQNQVLIAASTNAGVLDEVVSGNTGNTGSTGDTGTEGYFYLRVQGHDDNAFDADEPFQLTRTTTAANPECVGLTTHPADPDDAAPALPTQETVIVTDTNRLGLGAAGQEQARTDYLASLGQLANDTTGVVVDVAGSSQVQALWDQVAGHRGCPQAVNMVADAIQAIVDDWRNPNSQYVVIAGGDDVIPFFRYPDTSGLGPESQFNPPLLADTAAGASLLRDQVQSQDAYGSNRTVTIGGVTVPLPDLAVGRLVKTPGEIRGTIANFHELGGNLPEPDTSLVTGYDFLADAADAVNAEFRAALDVGDDVDTLIAHPATDTSPAEAPWTAGDLRTALLGQHHDVVYLAGHFSANDTLAADFDTTFDADELDPGFVTDPATEPPATNEDKLKNTLVLSAGCHSGYSIVDSAGVPRNGDFPGTNTFDWTQRMAQQKAVLIGGTGYQYGDTDFLEYSERLYLDVARRLHEPTPGSTPIAIGDALMLAKQDYLSGLTTLSGIDQKAMLQATLYGLPMTGFAAPRRTALPTRTSDVSTAPVGATTAGAPFGLVTGDLTGEHSVTTVNEPDDKTVVAGGSNFRLQWLEGADGVTIQPGAPALPKQVKDVTVPDKILRGVGFWSGDYTDDDGLDDTGVLPLTGAPAIEGSTPNSTFISETFFPQRLATVNYFGALGESGKTTLVLNPAQYKTLGDPEAAVPKNIVRNYSKLGMQLFYTPSNLGLPAGQPDPTLAAPPGISDVSGTAANGVVTFSARVTGDPVAGVQQVWATWTGRQGSVGHGHWRSVLLTQNPADSTLWSGTLTLPSGQPFEDVRFMVQAANGVGLVSQDAGEGDGYTVLAADAVETAGVNLTTTLPGPASPLGVRAHVSTAGGAPVSARDVKFTVLQGDTTLFETTATTGSGGNAVLQVPDDKAIPTGLFTVVASIFANGEVSASDTAVDVDTSTVEFQPSDSADLGVAAMVKDASGAPWANRKVVVSVSRGGDELYELPDQTTGPNGEIDVDGDVLGVPGGSLSVSATLYNVLGTTQRQQVTTDVAGEDLALTASPELPETLAGTAFSSFAVTVSDDRGPVEGVAVTYTLPSGSPGATFASGPDTTSPTTATVLSGADGRAPAPTMTARSTVGPFTMTAEAADAPTLQISMAAQYGIGKFVSPVAQETSTSATGTTPLKVAVLGLNGAPIADGAAQTLLSSGKIQVRYQRIRGATPPSLPSAWTSVSPSLISYEAKRDFFQADLKASTLGWTKGNTYRVEFRVLATGTGLPVELDLGSNFFNVTVTK